MEPNGTTTVDFERSQLTLKGRSQDHPHFKALYLAKEPS